MSVVCLPTNTYAFSLLPRIIILLVIYYLLFLYTSKIYYLSIIYYQLYNY